jgi:DNA repair protein SbcD/Mre11
MPRQPFRFLHASDFHLERPLSDAGDAPSHLADLLIEAPCLAAERVFEAAILEGAAFVVLAGDVLQPLLAGPRALLFLCDQFAKLAARGIDIYWCGGDIDPPEDWPSSLSLPPNVHVFPRGRVDEYLVHCEGVPVARVLGTSRERQQSIRTGEFRPDPSGLFTVAVAYGDADPAMQTRGINYWALGGRHDRDCTNRDSAASSLLSYCGTPQGRDAAETGGRGCTLVEVNEQNHVRTSLIPCDVARWLAERVVVEPTTIRQELEMRLRDRLRLLRESAPNMNLLVSWTIAGEGQFVRELRHSRLASELLESLRAEFGFNSPVAWSISLEAEPADDVPHDWYEQENLRGDFLRAVEQLRMNPTESLNIHEYLPESYRAGVLSGMLIDDISVRRRVLAEAESLGVELLGGSQPSDE